MIERNKKEVWVSNPNINKEAKINISDFIEKVSNVKALRTVESLVFTIYPTSKEEYNKNLKLWDYVNKNTNSLNDKYRKVFNVILPEELFNFLKFSKKSKVNNLVALSLAIRYVNDEYGRNIIEQQVYEPILEKMHSIINKYFYSFLHKDEEYADYEENYPEYFVVLWNKSMEKAQQELIGNSAMFKIISNPFNKINDFKLQVSFMSDRDWNNIILNSSEDSLERVESRQDVFDFWKNNLYLEHSELLEPVD